MTPKRYVFTIFFRKKLQAIKILGKYIDKGLVPEKTSGTKFLVVFIEISKKQREFEVFI